MGCTKNNDVILKRLSEEKWFDEDIVKDVINRVKNNAFKRRHRPLKNDLESGQIRQQICKNNDGFSTNRRSFF